MIYIQRWLVDIWKENILKNLELEKLKFKPVKKCLTKLKKKFGEGNDELVKIVYCGNH